MGALSVLNKDLSGVKPGLKTTELIVAAVFAVSSFLTSIGVLHTGLPASDRGIVQGAAAIGVALIAVGYAISRGIAKRSASTPLDYISTFLHNISTGDNGATGLATTALKRLEPDLFGALGVTPTQSRSIEHVISELEAFAKTHTALLDSELAAFARRVEGQPVAAVTVDTSAPASPSDGMPPDGFATESGPSGAWPTTPVLTTTTAAAQVTASV